MVRRALSRYQAMWLFALFDLPMDTAAKRRDYNRFRNSLKKMGFTMLQFSIYARYMPSEEASDILRKKIKAALPAEGQVRILAVTDRQFSKMEVYFGNKRHPTEDPPLQMSFF